MKDSSQEISEPSTIIDSKTVPTEVPISPMADMTTKLRKGNNLITL